MTRSASTYILSPWFYGVDHDRQEDLLIPIQAREALPRQAVQIALGNLAGGITVLL